VDRWRPSDPWRGSNELARRRLQSKTPIEEARQSMTGFSIDLDRWLPKAENARVQPRARRRLPAWILLGPPA
jgi:hypothetical protein